LKQVEDDGRRLSSAALIDGIDVAINVVCAFSVHGYVVRCSDVRERSESWPVKMRGVNGHVRGGSCLWAGLCARPLGHGRVQK
jgi:hypothetical protein